MRQRMSYYTTLAARAILYILSPRKCFFAKEASRSIDSSIALRHAAPIMLLLWHKPGLRGRLN